jgi:hypothetical protein
MSTTSTRPRSVTPVRWSHPQEGYDVAIVDLLNCVSGDDIRVMVSERVIDCAFDNPITLSGVMADPVLFDSLWEPT